MPISDRTIPRRGARGPFELFRYSNAGTADLWEAPQTESLIRRFEGERHQRSVSGFDYWTTMLRNGRGVGDLRHTKINGWEETI